MTVLGKLMALLLLTTGLVMMAWAVGVYTQRPGWFAAAPEGVDKGSSPVAFAQLKTEIDQLTRAAAVASGTWGTNLKALEEREAYRAERRRGYAERVRWAHKGNPKDLVDPANPKSGTGFYAPVIDPGSGLHDLSLSAAGKPKGEPIRGTDNTPLIGIDGLANSITGDVAEIDTLAKDIIERRQAYDKVSGDVVTVEKRLIAMNVIRDSVQAELFFLSTFEVSVYETRETVLRREKQLRGRLKPLGLINP